MTLPRVLVIAGSDSSGGAGVEADNRVLATHGVYSMTATTALTIQNTLGVQDVVVTPAEVVGRMIRANLEDIGCDAVKIGMLASAETVQVVTDTLLEFNVKTIVLDPVMVSTSGHQLLPNTAVRTLREKLLPKSTVLTPNIPEATLLLRDAGIEYDSPLNLEDLVTLAKQVHQLGPKAVLLKGGHIPLTKSYTKATTDPEKYLTVDILYDGNETTTIESPYQSSSNTHGTGCSLASAIAAHLARNTPLHQAIRLSIHYIAAGIRTAPNLGQGSGPINHFHSSYHLPFSPGHFIEYLLTRPDVSPTWHSYTHHPFPTALADGTLPLSAFKNYLIQDYLYLTHFARTHALAAYKSTRMSDILASSNTIQHIQAEMELHLEYCTEFGLSVEDIENTKESQACVAYSRFVLDVGMSQDWIALQVGLLSCLLGYQVVAKRLVGMNGRVEGKDGNRYWRWVEGYAGEEYEKAVATGRALIEEHITEQSPSRIEELVKIFVRATEMEVRFWELGAHDPVPGSGGKPS